MRAGPLRIGGFKAAAGCDAAIVRVQAWTRARFALEAGATVMVSELACRRPGCPPLETVVAFWNGEGSRRHFRVLKPVAEVVLDDLPPAWLKDALCAEPDDALGCC